MTETVGKHRGPDYVHHRFSVFFLAVMILLAGVMTKNGQAHAGIAIRDTRSRSLTLGAYPVRIVSLVPSVTEIICALGATDRLAGVTWEGSLPREKNTKTLVGGFFSPDIKAISGLEPDLVFVSSLQEATVARLEQMGVTTVYADTRSVDQSLDLIRLVGTILNKDDSAGMLAATIGQDLDLVKRKLSRLPEGHRRRVARLTGQQSIRVPSTGSLFNEMVRLSGGIPMEYPGDENDVALSPGQWQAFNPQFVVGVSTAKAATQPLLNTNGWKDVDAVRSKAIYWFPPDLAGRAATNTGRFVMRLTALIYPELFADPGFQVAEDAVLEVRPVPMDLPMITTAGIVHSRVADVRNKTLIISFSEPQTVLSTLEGLRTGIVSAGNHYIPPPSWGLLHNPGMETMKSRILKTLGLDAGQSTLLITGADMDNLAVSDKQFRDLKVIAAVTAGVCSNAQRMSQSQGFFYEPGTINIILMTNMALTQRAMARAIITATEAKTAALQDLDIRASDFPLALGATGTGTDNICVVQGKGPLLDRSGGHSRLGELIAAAVHDGVTRAVYLQNGIVPGRSVFQRLQERGITVHTLSASAHGTGATVTAGSREEMAFRLETLLMTPSVAGLIESALCLSDSRSQGQIADLTWFETACRSVAMDISGKSLTAATSFQTTESFPEPLRTAFDWILTGLDSTEIPPAVH